MENRMKILQRLLERDFKVETRLPETDSRVPLQSEEDMEKWRVFPAIRRSFLRGLFPGKGDDHVE